MPRATWSMLDAKKHFSELLTAACYEPQIVTKRGKPAVVVLNAEEYARLRRAERAAAPSFTEHLLAMPRDDGAFERMRLRLRKPGF